MSSTPLLVCDGHNLLFRACFGTPAQIWSRDEHDKRDLTTEFMFFALLRKGINEELPGWPEVVIVFDGQDGSAQRKETDADYKANRPADDNASTSTRAIRLPQPPRAWSADVEPDFLQAVGDLLPGLLHRG